MVFQEHNVGRAFQRVALLNPNVSAIISEPAVISYGLLFSITVFFARRMRELGIRQGSIVSLNTNDTVASISALLATSMLGAEFIVANGFVARQQNFAPTHFLKTSETSSLYGNTYVEIDESWMPTFSINPADGLDEFPGYINSNANWMYLFTSGTTGLPKMVSLSQRVVFDRTMAVAEDYPIAGTTMASLFSPTSRPFYARALATLLRSGTIVDSRDPLFWQQVGVNVVFGSPRQFETLLTSTFFDKPIERIEVGGAKVSDDLARRMLRSFKKVTVSYGACETSQSFMTLVDLAPDGSIQRVGRPLDSTVQIVDGAGEICAPGQEGIVRVRNSYMCQAYLNAPAATKKSFRDGWFYPGDLAFWTATGDLQITGREDDILSFGGLKLSADLIDRILQQTHGVKDVACFKSPFMSSENEIMAFVIMDVAIDSAACVQAMRDNYQRLIKEPCILGNIYAVKKIPRTPEGKLMRTRCETMVLENTEGIDGLIVFHRGE